MQIPSTFQIMGHDVNVVFDNEKMDYMNSLGLCQVTFNKITLATKADGKDIPKDVINHTYLHEVVHLILKTMGENELFKMKKFVGVFAGLLYQIIKTSKFN